MRQEIITLKEMISGNDPSLPTYYEKVLAQAKEEGWIEELQEINSILFAAVNKGLNRVSALTTEIQIKDRMGELADAINFAYIARKYFGKSRSWLYQRLKGNIVNGKPATFSPEEKETFLGALHDIQTRISAFSANA